MYVIEWSPVRLQTNRVAVISWLKWARRPESKIVPIIPDRPQFFSCGVPPGDSSHYRGRLPPEQVIQRKEKVFKRRKIKFYFLKKGPSKNLCTFI